MILIICMSVDLLSSMIDDSTRRSVVESGQSRLMSAKNVDVRIFISYSFIYYSAYLYPQMVTPVLLLSAVKQGAFSFLGSKVWRIITPL